MLLFCFLIMACATAEANTVLFTWDAMDTQHSYELKGSATFGVTNYNTTTGICNTGGCQLTIELTNLSPDMIANNPDYLDGVYWDIQQGTTNGVGGTAPGALLMASGTAPLGLIQSTGYNSTAANICAPGGGNGLTPSCSQTVKGGYQVGYSATGIGGGANATQDWGLSTTGQSYFQGKAVDTFDYSVVPIAGVSGSTYPFVYEKADFVFTGLTSSSIFVTNVMAAYGTAPDFAPPATLVSGEGPEPSTVVLVAGALVLLLTRKRRRA
jgi:hypothetical protein